MADYLSVLFNVGPYAFYLLEFGISRRMEDKDLRREYQKAFGIKPPGCYSIGHVRSLLELRRRFEGSRR